MNTYRYRLRFFIHAKGAIIHPEKRHRFYLPNGMEVQLSTLDAEKISDGKEFVVSGGGFSSEEQAYLMGIAIKNSLLFTGAILRIGVDAGKEETSCWLNPFIKDDFFKSHGIKLFENVHGVSVYSEEYPVKTFSFGGAALVFSSNIGKFSNKLCNNLHLSSSIKSKQKLALELYGASHYEKFDRAIFLTLILGVETLLDIEDRTSKERELVDFLVSSVNESEISLNDKNSMLGSLKHLYKDSISQSLRKMAQNYFCDKYYNGLSATSFIMNCYDARCKLVHTGEVDESKVNIGILAANLNVYLSDLLQVLIKSTASNKEGLK